MVLPGLLLSAFRSTRIDIVRANFRAESYKAVASLAAFRRREAKKTQLHKKSAQRQRLFNT